MIQVLKISLAAIGIRLVTYPPQVYGKAILKIRKFTRDFVAHFKCFKQKTTFLPVLLLNPAQIILSHNGILELAFF